MAKGAYKAVSSVKETDLPGLLGVIINHTDFQAVLAQNLNSKTNIFIEARQIRNAILHSSTQRVTDADLKMYINTMVTLLSDPAQLVNDIKAQNSIKELKKIENGSLSITDQDIQRVISEARTSIDEIKLDAIETLQNESKAQVENIKGLVQEQTNDINKGGQQEIKNIKEIGQQELRKINETGQQLKTDISKDVQQEVKNIKEIGQQERKNISEKGQQQKADIIKDGEQEINNIQETGLQEIKNIEESVQQQKTDISKAGQKEIKNIKDTGKSEIKNINETGQQQKAGISQEGQHEIKNIKETCKQEIFNINETGQQQKVDISKEGQQEIETIKETGQKQLVDINKKGQQEIKNITETVKKQKADLIKEGQEEIQIGKNAIRKETEASKDQLELKAEECKRTLQKEAAIAKISIQPTVKAGAVGIIPDIQYIKMKTELKRKLIQIYKARYLSIPLSPLNSEVDSKLDETYVRPHMQIESVPKDLKTEAYTRAVNKGNQAIEFYSEIFKKVPFSQDDQLLDNIYISGDAGSGKSSLCKNIVSTWCDVHAPSSQIDFEKINVETEENFKVIKKFDFLFYISLRDCLSEEDVEDMIKSLLPEKYHGIISELLDDEEEQCLIILDGLDEWAPPKQTKIQSSITKGLPNREVWCRCSILTTTRPWKLAHLRLKSSEIDRQINILGIMHGDEQLINIMVDILNTEYGRQKSSKEFVKLMSENKMLETEMMKTPILLKQLVCLWHDGKSIGESRCEIYSGMLELLFEIAQSRLANKMEDDTPSLKIQLPTCFSNSKKCHHLLSLILALAKLAFYTIVRNNKSSSLVFEKSVATFHGMSRAQMEFCLKAGILSQSRHKEKCTEQNVKVSFLHKTFQEFLAALYIALPHESTADPVDEIISTCNTVYEIMEMSKVFVFMAGMNPRAIIKISGHIYTIASADKNMQQYREGIMEPDYIFKPVGTNKNVRLIQELIYDCFKENDRNEHALMKLHLQDVIIDTELEILWQADIPTYLENIDSIKSASINVDTNLCVTDMTNLSLHELQLLYLYRKRGPSNVPFGSFKLLENCSGSLTVLSLYNLMMFDLTTEQFSNMLHGLLSLLSIKFEWLRFTHRQYQCLASFLSHRTNLRHIEMIDNHIVYSGLADKEEEEFKTLFRVTKMKATRSSNDYGDGVSSNDVSHCGGHEYCFLIYFHREFYILDLSRHNQLLILRTERHNCTPHINVRNLVKCDSQCRSTMNSIEGASKLQTLIVYGSYIPQTVVQSLPTLPNLQNVTIKHIDFGTEQLRLSPSSKHITRIVLDQVAMTKTCFLGFVNSIPNTQHSVTVEVNGITMLPEDILTKSFSSEYSDTFVSSRDRHSYREMEIVLQYISESSRFIMPKKPGATFVFYVKGQQQ